MNPTSSHEGDNNPRFDQWLRALSVAATFVTVLVGIFEFGASQRAAQDAAVRDSKKPFLAKQFALYFETAELVSEISNTSWDRISQRQGDHFNQLYWGPLSLVESGEVDDAMHYYGTVLTLYEEHRVSQDCIQAAALGVTHAMGRSLGDGWGQSGLTYKITPSRCKALPQ